MGFVFHISLFVRETEHKKVSCAFVELMHHKKVRLWVGDHLISEEKERSELNHAIAPQIVEMYPVQ